jgi:hypothetical protein
MTIQHTGHITTRYIVSTLSPLFIFPINIFNLLLDYEWPRTLAFTLMYILPQYFNFHVLFIFIYFQPYSTTFCTVYISPSYTFYTIFNSLYIMLLLRHSICFILHDMLHTLILHVLYVVGSKVSGLTKFLSWTNFAIFQYSLPLFQHTFHICEPVTLCSSKTTIYPSQHFTFRAAFVRQAGNFWTLLRTQSRTG